MFIGIFFAYLGYEERTKFTESKILTILNMHQLG